MSKRQATTKIIAGTFKGTKIPFKPSKLLRPTENKTKETLFNWLLNDLNKKIYISNTHFRNYLSILKNMFLYLDLPNSTSEKFHL